MDARLVSALENVRSYVDEQLKESGDIADAVAKLADKAVEQLSDGFQPIADGTQFIQEALSKEVQDGFRGAEDVKGEWVRSDKQHKLALLAQGILKGIEEIED